MPSSVLMKLIIMTLNFVICSILSLTSWWQQPLGKTYGLRCQNGVIVGDSFAFRKTKSFRQHALLVLRLALVNYLPLCQGQIVNDRE